MAAYIPRQGDIIAITFDPQSGHEQKGRRPAAIRSAFHFRCMYLLIGQQMAE
jgi:mRNA-degrading endonuclease toxin of MazEF toxin-antitoxin module